MIGGVTVVGIHVLYEVCTGLFTKEKFEQGKRWNATQSSFSAEFEKHLNCRHRDNPYDFVPR